MPEPDLPPPIPVHVLSGFLGAGKTTAIRRLLEARAEHERIAVIVNEFGDLGIDGALLSDCMSCVLKEVPGGCVCCTAIGDLEASIEEMMGLVGPTRIVVEPTGLANPAEIVDLLRSMRWRGRFEIRPVITLLDPTLDTRARYAEGGLYREQVDVGDILVISRTDLAGEPALRAAETFALELRPPKMLVVRAANGVLPDAAWDTPLPSDREAGRAGGALTLLPSHESDGDAPERPHAHETVEGHEGHGILRGPERVYDTDRLAAFFEGLAAGRLELGGSVARAKGIFNTTTGWRAIEIAGGRLSSAATVYRRDNRFDVILKRPAAGDFEKIGAALEDALIPEGEPLLSIEDASGLVRAFDARALAAIGAAPMLGDLFRRAALTGAEAWVWLVSEGGLFGVGAPRVPLEKGRIIFAENGAPIPADAGGPFRFELPDDAALGFEDEVDQCREVPALCAVRVVPAPGGDV